MWWFFYSQISEETWKRPPEILSKYKESISGDILTDENAHASHSHMHLLQTAPLLIQTQNQTHTDSVVASNESSFPSKIAAVAWITTSGRAALGVSARQPARKSWAGKWRGNGRPCSCREETQGCRNEATASVEVEMMYCWHKLIMCVQRERSCVTITNWTGYFLMTRVITLRSVKCYSTLLQLR